ILYYSTEKSARSPNSGYPVRAYVLNQIVFGKFRYTQNIGRKTGQLQSSQLLREDGHMKGRLSYKKTGVNIEVADVTKKAMTKSLETTDKRILNKIGAFATLLDGTFPGYN